MHYGLLTTQLALNHVFREDALSMQQNMMLYNAVWCYGPLTTQLRLDHVFREDALGEVTDGRMQLCSCRGSKVRRV
jgi:hypothetical protein